MNQSEVYLYLKPLVKKIKVTAFTPEYRKKATDAEALGLIIAWYFEWDGLKILETSREALEDANFHTEAEVIEKQIDKIKKDFAS